MGGGSSLQMTRESPNGAAAHGYHFAGSAGDWPDEKGIRDWGLGTRKNRSSLISAHLPQQARDVLPVRPLPEDLPAAAALVEALLHLIAARRDPVAHLLARHLFQLAAARHAARLARRQL